MRDRRLHTALRAFAEEAAWTLAAETTAGAELPFEIVEEGGGRGRPALYCYRPDTAGFIAERGMLLERGETWLPAVHALSVHDGLDGYLRSRGHTRVPLSGRERAEAGLRALLEALFEDSTEFVLSEERFARAYSELEELLVAGRSDIEVIVPVLGLELDSPELALGDGLSLVRSETLDRVPEEAAWDGAEPNALALVRGEDSDVAAAAAVRVRDLVTALRLFDGAGVAMGPAAWIRTAGGPWLVAATGSGGRPSGTLRVAAEQEDELRAFCNLVWRRMPRGGVLAWALARYEMGCERPAAHRLSDHLLALRALLEPEGAQSGALPERIAALCSEPDDRDAVTERVAHAASLECALIAGHDPGPGLQPIADEVAEQLRAILRDVLCGHLDSDVRRLADELLETAAA